VKVSCSEGVATTLAPESCVNTREGVGEALTVERAGQPLSRESPNPEADVLDNAEGNKGRCDNASTCYSGAVKDPGMCGSSLHGNREVSGLISGWTQSVASGRRGAVAGEARAREV
jgi:hypothetical protein